MSLNSLYTDADHPRLKPPGVGKKPKKKIARPGSKLYYTCGHQ